MTRQSLTAPEKRDRDGGPRKTEQQRRPQRAQERARKYLPDGVSLADELLSERRREAANEQSAEKPRAVR